MKPGGILVGVSADYFSRMQIPGGSEGRDVLVQVFDRIGERGKYQDFFIAFIDGMLQFVLDHLL